MYDYWSGGVEKSIMADASRLAGLQKKVKGVNVVPSMTAVEKGQQKRGPEQSRARRRK